MAQVKEQFKAPGKIQLNHEEIVKTIRCTVQKTGYQDTPRTHWVLQQHKRDPGSNKGCIM